MVLALLIVFLVIVMPRLNKKKKNGTTGAAGTKNVKIKVPLKYLSNFW